MQDALKHCTDPVSMPSYKHAVLTASQYFQNDCHWARKMRLVECSRQTPSPKGAVSGFNLFLQVSQPESDGYVHMTMGGHGGRLCVELQDSGQW